MDQGSDPADQGADLRICTEPGATVVAVSGEVDSQSIPGLHAAVTEVIAAAGTRRVVLDLNSVVFFGSAGIAFLTRASSEARAAGVELHLAADDGSRVHRVLEMMGLTRLLAIFPTRERAVQGH